MKSLMAIIIREFKYIISNKRLLAILLIIPVFYTSLLVALLRTGCKWHKTVVVDLDKTPMSRTIIDAFNKSVKFDLIASLQSEQEVTGYIESEQADAAIVIPKGFSTNVYKKTNLRS